MLNVCKANGYCIVRNCSFETKKELKDFVEGREVKLIGYTSDSVAEIAKPRVVKHGNDYRPVLIETGNVVKKIDITIDNFFVKSKGNFIELKSIPENFEKFFDSKTSTYYTNNNKDVLIRVSDHWGENIRFCSWFLIGYEKFACWKWKKKYGSEMKIGLINICDLKYNNSKPKKQLRENEIKPCLYRRNN